MFEKLIRKSQRGLTFSFPVTGKLSIGCHYDYLIDRSSGTPSIRIVPAESGRYRMSRKRNGGRWNALVDLRNKEVLSAISEMEQIRICISDDMITVVDGAAICTRAKQQKTPIVLQFPRRELTALRMAAGMNDAAAMDALLSGAQISIDEYMASISDPLSIPTVHTDLPDVYTLVSLFSGAGILDWPFAQDSRFQIRYAIDYEASACETYRENIGMHIVHGDIHRAFTDNGYPLDETVGTPDVVIGGPSCKPFSNANRHTRLEDHPDSDLVCQYMRIVQKLKPKVFVMENVPEVLTACDGTYFEKIKRVAEECGYNLTSQIVQDNEVGGYTTRRRAIILGSRIGPASFRGVEIASGGKTAGDALRKVDSSWPNYSDVTLPKPDTKKRMSFVPQGGNYTSIPMECRTDSKNRHSCTYRRLSMSEPSPTIVNWRKPPLIHPEEDRTLTVSEAAALQGLPKEFKVCGTLGQKQQQIGNSVPVAIGTYIKNAVLALLGRTDERKYNLAFSLNY